MTLFNLAYLAAALLGAVALLVNAAALRRRWGNPRFGALCAALFLITAIFWFAAPVTIGAVNRAIGIANVSALVVYALVVAFAAATLTFAFYWRYPPQAAWSRSRWIIAAYLAVIAVMVVLFAVSEVPTERRTDFDTYYADQPTVAAFLLAYLVSTLIGGLYLVIQLRRWARPTADGDIAKPPANRQALLLFIAATACPIAFDIVKIAAVVLNWFDVHALDGLSNAAPLLNVLAVLLVLAGVAARRRPDPSRRPATA